MEGKTATDTTDGARGPQEASKVDSNPRASSPTTTESCQIHPGPELLSFFLQIILQLLAISVVSKAFSLLSNTPPPLPQIHDTWSLGKPSPSKLPCFTPPSHLALSLSIGPVDSKYSMIQRRHPPGGRIQRTGPLLKLSKLSNIWIPTLQQRFDVRYDTPEDRGYLEGIKEEQRKEDRDDCMDASEDGGAVLQYFLLTGTVRSPQVHFLVFNPTTS
ncbi:hypothetical protein EV360DRAFT_76689 [Lentinula raphanica]|nr:hypothetical protein EV360DRAFT_76689 [Lentinula raphanica]